MYYHYNMLINKLSYKNKYFQQKHLNYFYLQFFANLLVDTLENESFINYSSLISATNNHVDF